MVIDRPRPGGKMDRVAFERVIKAHYSYLVRLAQRITRQDVDEAADVVHMAMARIKPAKLDMLEEPTCLGCLIQMVKWEALRVGRADDIQPAVDFLTDGDDEDWRTHSVPTGPSQYDDLLSIELEDAIKDLPPNLRRVMELWLEGYNLEEIAGLSGCSWQNIQELWHRAVRLLRERWHE